MEPRHQVFVSATISDMSETRDESLRALFESGCFPVGMEYFGARSESSWYTIARLIRESDYFILLIGNRYGTYRPRTKMSYTESEYDLAVQTGLPIAVIRCDSIAPLSDNEDSEHQESLRRFKEKLAKHQPAWASSASDIPRLVAQSLANLRQGSPREGWIRPALYFAAELRTVGAFFRYAAARLVNAQNYVHIQHLPKVKDRTWVFRLLQSIISCRRRGIHVSITAKEESRALTLLTYIGCSVTVSRRPRLAAVVVDPDGALPVIAHALSPGSDMYGIRISGHPARSLASIIAPVRNPPHDLFRPSLAVMDWSDLEQRLKRVGAYAGRGVRIEPGEVCLADVRPQTTEVEEAKIVQLDSLNGLYDDAGLLRYVPAMLMLRGGCASPVVPPVLEEDVNGWRVAEGHTRLWNLWKSGDTSLRIQAVLVRNCAPLPDCPTYGWDEVEPTLDPLRQSHVAGHSRSIERCVHMTPDGKSWDFVTPAREVA